MRWNGSYWSAARTRGISSMDVNITYLLSMFLWILVTALAVAAIFDNKSSMTAKVSIAMVMRILLWFFTGV